jgi:hypothetical protein
MNAAEIASEAHYPLAFVYQLAQHIKRFEKNVAGTPILPSSQRG